MTWRDVPYLIAAIIWAWIDGWGAPDWVISGGMHEPDEPTDA